MISAHNTKDWVICPSMLLMVAKISQAVSQSVCTDLKNFPNLQNNYTMLGKALSNLTANGLLSCLEECKTELLCKAFTFDMMNLDCKLYMLFKHGNTINQGPLLHSAVEDWPASDVDKNMMKTTGTSLMPGYHCYTLMGSHAFYNGTIDTVISGDTCQRWDSKTPHVHIYGVAPFHFNTGENMTQVSNYCRAIITDHTPLPWCYTMNPHVRWQFCNVPKCI